MPLHTSSTLHAALWFHFSFDPLEVRPRGGGAGRPSSTAATIAPRFAPPPTRTNINNNSGGPELTPDGGRAMSTFSTTVPIVTAADDDTAPRTLIDGRSLSRRSSSAERRQKDAATAGMAPGELDSMHLKYRSARVQPLHSPAPRLTSSTPTKAPVTQTSSGSVSPVAHNTRRRIDPACSGSPELQVTVQTRHPEAQKEETTPRWLVLHQMAEQLSQKRQLAADMRDAHEQQKLQEQLADIRAQQRHLRHQLLKNAQKTASAFSQTQRRSSSTQRHQPARSHSQEQDGTAAIQYDDFSPVIIETTALLTDVGGEEEEDDDETAISAAMGGFRVAVAPPSRDDVENSGDHRLEHLDPQLRALMHTKALIPPTLQPLRSSSQLVRSTSNERDHFQVSEPPNPSRSATRVEADLIDDSEPEAENMGPPQPSPLRSHQEQQLPFPEVHQSVLEATDTAEPKDSGDDEADEPMHQPSQKALAIGCDVEEVRIADTLDEEILHSLPPLDFSGDDGASRPQQEDARITSSGDDFDGFEHKSLPAAVTPANDAQVGCAVAAQSTVAVPQSSATPEHSAVNAVYDVDDTAPSDLAPIDQVGDDDDVPPPPPSPPPPVRENDETRPPSSAVSDKQPSRHSSFIHIAAFAVSDEVELVSSTATPTPLNSPLDELSVPTRHDRTQIRDDRRVPRKTDFDDATVHQPGDGLAWYSSRAAPVQRPFSDHAFPHQSQGTVAPNGDEDVQIPPPMIDSTPREWSLYEMEPSNEVPSKSGADAPFRSSLPEAYDDDADILAQYGE